MSILLCFTQLILVGFCLNMLASSSLVSAIVVAMVVYVNVGRRYQNRGEVLLYGCLFWCFQISTSFGKNRLVHH